MRGAVALMLLTAATCTRAGNTACRTDSLDWYTQSVGESPCRTYERLRQTCNSHYEVGSLAIHSPGDRCDDQVSDCCCNSVAFALSMLCQNCQYGVGSGLNGDHGFDAPVGTYGEYLYECPKPTNQSLPSITQKAVCNEGLNIPSYLYSLFWVDGAWFYEYTKQTAQLRILSEQNTTAYCDPLTPSSSSESSSGSSAKSNVDAIVGGVIGGLALLFVVCLTVWFIRRRLPREKNLPSVEAAKDPVMSFEPYIHRPVARHYSSDMSYEPPTSIASYTYPSSASPVAEPVTHFVPPPPPPPLPSKLGITTNVLPMREQRQVSPTLSPVSSINSGDSLHIPPSDRSKLPPLYRDPK